MSFSFSDLNLSGVDVGRASGTGLKPGRYICKVTEAKLEDVKSGSGKKLTVSLAELGGAGSITHWINVYLPKSEEATRIGREQLKALLTHGGHPSPDKPGDVRTMKGLIVGVVVVSEEYVKNGETRKGSAVSGYVSPTEIDPDFKAGAKAAGSGELDDEIPF